MTPTICSATAVTQTISILLVENNPADVRLIQELLANAAPGVFRIVHVDHLRQAIEQLHVEKFDVALVDLMLPDSSGIATVERLQAVAPHLPIVVLSTLHDEDLALKIVQTGVQDYLVKGSEDGPVLGRALRYAIERKRRRRDLEYLAQYDALTGLPNRVLFNDRLRHAVAHAKRNGNPLVVLFLDLDGFKAVNDTLGHDAGDELLRTVADRLTGCLRPADTVARLGGDEFLVLLDGISQNEDAAIVAQNLLTALRAPMTLAGTQVYVTASIGIAVFPRDGVDPEAMVQNADAAMYQAKALGRSSYQFYAPEMNHRARERVDTVNALRHALQAQEFRLYFQPVCDLATGRVTGVETLLRWQHPERGLLSPPQFIHLLEESGMIVPVGEWVLRNACHQYQAWRRAGAPPVRLMVNVSMRQFWSEDMADAVCDILADCGMEPSLLTLELTENVLLQPTEALLSNISALQAAGVQFAIDDFGTGYSSLAHLKRLPIQALKVDRSFVQHVADEREGAAIVKAVISLARHLHLQVIAEGVETAGQMEFLRAEGCTDAQGYFFSGPLSSEAVLPFLAPRTGGLESAAMLSSLTGTNASPSLAATR